MPLPRVENICKGKTQTGEPCRNPAVRGSDYCRFHSRGAPKGNQYAVKHGIYSEAPQLKCDMCIGADQCAHFTEGGACYYEREEISYDLTDIRQVLIAFMATWQQQLKAYKRGQRFEVFQGGMVDAETARMGQRLQQQLMSLHRLLSGALERPQVAVTQVEIGSITIMQEFQQLRAVILEQVCAKCRRKLIKQLPGVTVEA